MKSVSKSIRLFDFISFGSSDETSRIIISLDSTKKTSGVISTKIVILANKKMCNDLANCIKESVKKNELPNELKVADITPIFKKGDPLNKENHRPVNMLTAWSLDEPGENLGIFLIHLSKAYDCVNHEIVIAKLAAYKLNWG